MPPRDELRVTDNHADNSFSPHVQATELDGALWLSQEQEAVGVPGLRSRHTWPSYTKSPETRLRVTKQRRCGAMAPHTIAVPGVQSQLPVTMVEVWREKAGQGYGQALCPDLMISHPLQIRSAMRYMQRGFRQRSASPVTPSSVRPFRAFPLVGSRDYLLNLHASEASTCFAQALVILEKLLV